MLNPCIVFMAVIGILLAVPVCVVETPSQARVQNLTPGKTEHFSSRVRLHVPFGMHGHPLVIAALHYQNRNNPFNFLFKKFLAGKEPSDDILFTSQNVSVATSPQATQVKIDDVKLSDFSSSSVATHWVEITVSVAVIVDGNATSSDDACITLILSHPAFTIELVTIDYAHREFATLDPTGRRILLRLPVRVVSQTH